MMVNVNQSLIDVESVIEGFPNNSFSIFKNKKILITGCTGFIGFYFSLFFIHINKSLSLDISLYLSTRDIDKASDFYKKFNYFEPYNLSFINYMEGDSEKYDYIFHTASPTNPVDLAFHPLDVIKSNVFDTEALLHKLKPNFGKFIFFSTREIYGKKVTKKIQVAENDYGLIDPISCRSSYPLSKKMAENLITSFSYQKKTNYLIYRISHTYGPLMKLNDGRVLSDIIGAAALGKDINLLSDGKHIISPTYISDVLSGVIYSIINGKDNEVYNLSNSEEAYPIIDIAKITAYSAGVDFASNDISSNPSCNAGESSENSLYLRHDTGILCSNKIKSLGWEFKISLKDGVRKTLNAYR